MRDPSRPPRPVREPQRPKPPTLPAMLLYVMAVSVALGILATISRRRLLDREVVEGERFVACLALAGTKRNALNIAVHEAMTQKVLSVRLDDNVHNALATMKGARVRRLPVSDDTGRLKGILSIEDVVVRGLEGGGINTDEIVAALRAMYVRTPVVIESATMESASTPG